MITSKELTSQIKKVLNMKTNRSRNSKLDTKFVRSNLEYYIRNRVIDLRAYEIACGIWWAFTTGRLNVNAEWKIRQMNAWQFVNLIGLVSDNCPTQNDIPRWINQNESKVEAL